MIVQFQHTIQVSEDSWKYITETAEFPETATLKEVKEWVNKKMRAKDSRMKTDVTIIDPEQP